MKHYLVAGMSHVESLRRGWKDSFDEYPGVEVEVFNMREWRREPQTMPAGQNKLYIDDADMASDFRERVCGNDAVILCIGGNEHNIFGLAEIEPLDDALRIVGGGVARGLDQWLTTLLPAFEGQFFLLVPPPPIESEAHILAKPGPFREKLAQYGLRNAPDRLTLWHRQRDAIERVGQRHGVPVLHPPANVFSPQGFLAPDCCGADPTHGNANYGRRTIAHLVVELGHGETAPGSHPTSHPYVGLPAHAYWRKAISDVPAGEVDPVVAPRFILKQRDKVATAGSCFAQHISRRLRHGGFRYLVTEEPREGDAESIPGEADYDFSARYGNIYTARQLVQLFDCAFGYYQPLERIWERPDGGYCDPFRPRIRAQGYPAEAAVHDDRRQHLAAVRQMFRQLDVFVFTLGLTECWISRLDGAAYPIAPGVAGGRYDPARHVFVNFTVAEVRADLELFVARLRQVNPGARVLLTVSPVSLAATREEQHVLVSTVHSKSILRAAAGEVVAAHSHVEYFPSYEIITGPHAMGDYFAADRRSVTEAGVDHVMRVFMSRMTSAGQNQDRSSTATTEAYAEMQDAAAAACDEELYAKNI